MLTVTDDWTGEEEEVTTSHKGGFALHPHASLRKSWDLSTLLVLVYLSISLPFRIAFGVEQTKGWEVTDSMIDTLFFIDILLNCITGFYTADGELVMGNKAILQRYSKGWFWLDLIATLPWDEMVSTSDGDSGGDDESGGSVDAAAGTRALQGLKLLRLVRLLRLLRLKRIMSRSSLWVNMRYSVRSISKFFVFLLVVAHWLACFWFMIANLEGFSEDAWTSKSAPPGEDYALGTLGTRYVVSVYWAITTMTTIGYGDIVPNTNEERLFCIVCMLMGSATYAYGITQIVNLLANLDVAEIRYRRQMDELNEYMDLRSLPHALRSRVREYYEFKKHHSGYFLREKDIMADLPMSLREELSIFVNAKLKDRLVSFPLFHGLEDAFVNSLMTRLRFATFPPAEPIVYEGERGSSMFFVNRGRLEIKKKFMGVLRTVTEGEYFGEVALYHNRGRRTATVITVSYCELVSLRRVDVEETLSSHPHIISAIRERAETLFNKDSAEIAKRKAGGDASGGAGSATATPRESSERESPRYSPHASGPVPGTLQTCPSTLKRSGGVFDEGPSSPRSSFFVRADAQSSSSKEQGARRTGLGLVRGVDACEGDSTSAQSTPRAGELQERRQSADRGAEPRMSADGNRAARMVDLLQDRVNSLEAIVNRLSDSQAELSSASEGAAAGGVQQPQPTQQQAEGYKPSRLSQ